MVAKMKISEGKVVLKKKVSKKNKKSWRKNCNTKDVDDFLEDKRLEERLGAPFSERQDSELFHIDKIADDTKDATVRNPKKKSIKPNRCFQLLENSSAVPDPISVRNRVKTPEERKHVLVKVLKAQRKEKGILKRKEIVANQHRLSEKIKKQLSKPKIGEFASDIWEGDDDKSMTGPWITKTTLLHTLKNTGQIKKKLPEKFLKKPFVTPPVEAPHPGTSYNPTFGDHQSLLKEVAEKELEVKKEEAHLNRVTSKMFSRVTESERQNMWMEEMSQGLPKEAEEETQQENEGGDSYKAINPPVKIKKKTLKERRKLKEARQQALQQKQHKLEKKKISDLYKVKIMNKEIEEKKEKLEKIREKRKKMNAIKEQGTRKLSKVKFEPLDLEFNLSKEISGNLRGIKPQGSVLVDRFKSLQKRNVIEPAIRR
ncbi:hypothetical protein L9F63_022536, partial [Diploptera punctata]